MSEKKELVSVCAWCQCKIAADAGRLSKLTPAEFFELTKSGRVTHGICKPCYDDQISAIARLRYAIKWR